MSYVILISDDGDIDVPAEKSETPLAEFLGGWDHDDEQLFEHGLLQIEEAERDAQVDSAVLKFV